MDNLIARVLGVVVVVLVKSVVKLLVFVLDNQQQFDNITSMRLTTKQIDDYLKNPNHCPKCKSEEIEGGGYDYESNPSREVTCSECGRYRVRCTCGSGNTVRSQATTNRHVMETSRNLRPSSADPLAI
jgi:ribosomal protein S27E